VFEWLTKKATGQNQTNGENSSMKAELQQAFYDKRHGIIDGSHRNTRAEDKNESLDIKPPVQTVNCFHE